MLTKFFLVFLLSLVPNQATDFNFFKSDILKPYAFEIKSDFPKKTIDSLGVKIDAEAAVILDLKTKKILFEKNAYQKLPPASLTKIMTAQVVLDSKKRLDEPAKVSKKSQNMIESTIGLEEGEVVTLKDLLAGGLIASGNDAAEALAENISDGDIKKFVAQMNEKAAKLGLASTHFENVTGLDDANQFSSAYDLAILFSEAQKNSLFRELISKKEYKFQAITPDNKHEFKTTNRLLKDDYPKVFGGKTGYTDAAGYCLAILAQNEERSQIVTIVLGASQTGQHFQETKALVDWTFKNYKWR